MELTKEQQDKINAINKWFDNAVAELDRGRKARMENYYNCIDDYSWGGICDKAANQQEDMWREQKRLQIEEVMNGGYFVVETETYRIVDAEGNCSTRCGCGEYGYFFSINGKFVGLPKRLATLTKKGYTLEKVERTYHCTFKDITFEGRVHCKSMELVSEVVTPITQETMPTWLPSYDYYDYQYDSYFFNSKD